MFLILEILNVISEYRLLPQLRYLFYLVHHCNMYVCVQLASKKGGLGAQKVSSQSFSELEKKAQAADKIREKEESFAGAKKNITTEESM